MKLHIKSAVKVLFKGLPTIHTLAKINASHQRRIEELEGQQGAAAQMIKDMVKPEALKKGASS